MDSFDVAATRLSNSRSDGMLIWLGLTPGAFWIVTLYICPGLGPVAGGDYLLASASEQVMVASLVNLRYSDSESRTGKMLAMILS